MLDQEVDPLVLQRVAAPENLLSHMFALVRDRPEFDSSTPDLRMLDMSGPPASTPRSRGCGSCDRARPRSAATSSSPTLPVRMPLDGPLLPADWTAEINYLANNDGSMTLSLPDGVDDEGDGATRAEPGVRATARRGRRHPGARNTSALSVCLASGPVGYVAPR